MTILALQEFETPEDALAHYGKKGMKWGVRKQRSLSVSTAARPTRREILDARDRVAKENKQVKTAIKKEKANASQAKAQSKQNIAKIKASALKNPDRLTALRMTKGEKAAFAIWSAAYTGATGGIGAITPATVAVQRTVIRRKLEKAQRS